MLVPVLLFIVGLVLLIKGGDWFVDGATGIAHRFHVPELLIGATVVSIGTTLPEVMVSATSALSGHGEMSYGNAIGSIICNAALIAALTITIKPSDVERKTLVTPVSFFFLSAIIYVGISYFSGNFTRVAGVVFLMIFVVYVGLNIYQVTKLPTASVAAAESEKKQESEEENSLAKDLLLLVVGAALIAIGADLLVDNGILIAEALHVPESVIALTFIALGTSLPELVTAITSLSKGHGALSLGNVIGANLFNLVLVSGVSITLNPFSIPQTKMIAGHNASLIVDLPVMLFAMLLLTVPTLVRGKLSRWQGVLLLLTYGCFCILQFAL